MFDRFRAGEAGLEAARAARDCFERWCERSYIVPPSSLHRLLEKALAAEDASAERTARLLSGDLGFRREAAALVSESLCAERKNKKSTPDERLELPWPLYEQALWSYATETAHVCAARLLLYRAGEDLGISRSEMESFAPSVYESGEFDWWRVVRRDSLSEMELARLEFFEEQLDLSTQRLLRFLSAYDLGAVDLDLWRDIYQHCLPAEERQRLGGFYTPQELVDMTLDLAKYCPSVDQLCQKSLLDPASGSGAFVVSALERLLAHLNDRSHACHRHLYARHVPDWERAEGMLTIILANIHAIDVHPFATFLTFINFLFAVLPLYARVRARRRGFRLDAAILRGDSLLTTGENDQPVILSEPLDWTVQGEAKNLSSSKTKQLRGSFVGRRGDLLRMTGSRSPSAACLAAQKFDFVVGNPPWGGILKGRLAPIFDERYKKQLAAEYPDSYTGKLDIYGLFYDRALQWLKPGGTVALLTQGSFIDKDWAAPHIDYRNGQPIHIMGLRRKLAEQASLRYLVDLNPFGKVFFGAMNIPCIGVFRKRPARQREQAIVLLSSKKSWPRVMSAAERRGQVVSLVRRCLEGIEKSSGPLQQDFATAFRFPLARLREFRGGRWLLTPKDFRIRTRPGWPRVAQLLEASQGLTVGGEGCLPIFLMTEARASELGLEPALLHPIIKGHETKPWRLEWRGNVILYPYACDEDGRWRRAFACEKASVLDALDFEHPADKFEQEWVRQYGINPICIEPLFEHRRDHLKLFKHPRAAEYLLKFYQPLSSRTFKKRNLRDFGRAWYEFIWPRDAEVIFGKPKIISPRLTPRVRFAFDQDGMGVQDSCVALAVSDNTRHAYEEFRGRLSGLVGHEVEMPTVLRYLLAFLNSSYAQELLTTGHRPRPGDVFQVSDQLLEELSVPVCKTRRELQQLLDAVDACMVSRTPHALERAEAHLNSLVLSLYSKAHSG
jgi:hypothetical protein